MGNIKYQPLSALAADLPASMLHCLVPEAVEPSIQALAEAARGRCDWFRVALCERALHGSVSEPTQWALADAELRALAWYTRAEAIEDCCAYIWRGELGAAGE